MRIATGFDNTACACECLSLTTQVLYSFCQTELSERGATPPWQLGEAHEPGPVYFGGSAAKHVALNAMNHRALKDPIL